MLIFLNWIYFTFFASQTMIISKVLLLLLFFIFHFLKSVLGILQKLIIHSEFKHHKYGIAHNIRMSKNEIEELFYKKFPHFKCFSFSFSFCINIYIFCNWVNIGQSILGFVFRLFVNLLQSTEMYLYSLIYAFVCILPQVFITGLRILFFSKRQRIKSLQIYLSILLGRYWGSSIRALCWLSSIYPFSV